MVEIVMGLPPKIYLREKSTAKKITDQLQIMLKRGEQENRIEDVDALINNIAEAIKAQTKYNVYQSLDAVGKKVCVTRWARDLYNQMSLSSVPISQETLNQIFENTADYYKSTACTSYSVRLSKSSESFKAERLSSATHST